MTRGPPTFSRPPPQVHQTAGVGSDDRRSTRPGELVVGHCQRDLGLAHRERPAEPAAEIRPRERDDLRARAAEQPSRLTRDVQLPEHVAGVVVGDPATRVPRQRPEAGVDEEGGELPHLERLHADELGQVVRGHRRAGARGDHDRQLARERAHEALRHAPRRRVVPRVEGGLPAAHLPPREHDLVPGAPEQRLGIGDRLREGEVAETGREELHGRHGSDSMQEPGARRASAPARRSDPTRTARRPAPARPRPCALPLPDLRAAG